MCGERLLSRYLESDYVTNTPHKMTCLLFQDWSPGISTMTLEVIPIWVTHTLANWHKPTFTAAQQTGFSCTPSRQAEIYIIYITTRLTDWWTMLANTARREEEERSSPRLSDTDDTVRELFQQIIFTINHSVRHYKKVVKSVQSDGFTPTNSL